MRGRRFTPYIVSRVQQSSKSETCPIHCTDIPEAHLRLEPGLRRPEVSIPAAMAPRVRPL